MRRDAEPERIMAPASITPASMAPPSMAPPSIVPLSVTAGAGISADSL